MLYPLALALLILQASLVLSGRVGFRAQLATGLTTPTGLTGTLSTAAPIVAMLVLYLGLVGQLRVATAILLAAAEAVVLSLSGFRGAGVTFVVACVVLAAMMLPRGSAWRSRRRLIVVMPILFGAAVMAFVIAAQAKNATAVQLERSSAGTSLFGIDQAVHSVATRLDYGDPLNMAVTYRTDPNLRQAVAWPAQLEAAVPRYIWPNKPIVDYGQNVSVAIYGLQYGQSSSFITLIGDTYVNLGPLGLLIGGLVFGLLISALEYAVRSRGRPAMLVLAAVLSYTILTAEVSLPFTVIDLVRTFLVSFVLVSAANFLGGGLRGAHARDTGALRSRRAASTRPATPFWPTFHPSQHRVWEYSAAHWRKPSDVLARTKWRTLAAIGAGNVAFLVLGAASGVIASRVLGPRLRGEFVAAQTWATISAVVLTFGVAQAVVTFVRTGERLTGPFVLHGCVAAGAGATLFYILAETSQPWLSPVGITGATALLVGGLVAANAAGFAQRLGRMTGAFQVVRVLPQFVGLCAILIVWQFGSLDPNVWLLAIGVGVLVPAAVLLSSILRTGDNAHGRFVIRPPAALVRAAVGAFPVALGAQLVYRLDSLIVAAYLEPYKVALYAVAVTAATACATIGQTVGMLTFSDLRFVTQAHEQWAIVRRATALALIVTSAMAVPVALAAPWLIRIVYGNAFVAATDATRVLVLAAIPLAADYLLLHVLLNLSAVRDALFVQTIVTIFTIALLGWAAADGSLVQLAGVSLVIYPFSSALLFAATRRRITRSHPTARAMIKV